MEMEKLEPPYVGCYGWLARAAVLAGIANTTSKPNPAGAAANPKIQRHDSGVMC